MHTSTVTDTEGDRATSYRRFHRDQLDRGRLVATLRELELPLEEIRELLGTDDPAERRAVLGRHRDRLAARITRLGRVQHHLMHLIDPTQTTPEDHMTSQSTLAAELDPNTQRAFAAALFNRVWQLLEQPERSAREVDEMVNAAHASRYFWGAVGTATNHAIGDWQIARVYSTLRRPEPAVVHARRCLDHAGQVEGEAWLLASAYEGLARAYAVSGDRAAALEWKDKAVRRLAEVSDPDEREIVERDIASLPL